MASSPLGKRAGGGESSTQADKGNKVKEDPSKELNELAQKKFKNATTCAATNNNATKKGKSSEVKIKSENGNKMDIDDAEHV